MWCFDSRSERSDAVGTVRAGDGELEIAAAGAGVFDLEGGAGVSLYRAKRPAPAALADPVERSWNCLPQVLELSNWIVVDADRRLLVTVPAQSNQDKVCGMITPFAGASRGKYNLCATRAKARLDCLRP
jgi:hypothetical protein